MAERQLDYWYFAEDTGSEQILIGISNNRFTGYTNLVEVDIGEDRYRMLLWGSLITRMTLWWRGKSKFPYNIPV